MSIAPLVAGAPLPPPVAAPLVAVEPPLLGLGLLPSVPPVAVPVPLAGLGALGGLPSPQPMAKNGAPSRMSPKRHEVDFISFLACRGPAGNQPILV